MRRLCTYKHATIADVLEQSNTSATLSQFISPAGEQSVLKGIPNTQEYHDAVDRLAAKTPIIRRYRGPRFDWLALYCLKSNARTFTVYTVNPVVF